MAVNLTDMQMRKEGGGNMQGEQDPRVMQRAVIICGIAVIILIGIRTGFWDNVLP